MENEEMENLDSVSAVNSRLAALSLSSFPGITSENCQHHSQERLHQAENSQLSVQTSEQEALPSGDAASKLCNQSSPAKNLEEGKAPTWTNSALSQNVPAESVYRSDPLALEARLAAESIKEQHPPLQVPTVWTSPDIKEFKAKLRHEKGKVLTVYRGDVLTVNVPTVPEGKQVCWEFATDNYDIGFGIYFDWTPVVSRAITVQVSESSEDEDEEEDVEGPVSPGDVEKGSKTSRMSHLGEILPVYRQDSHLMVQHGSHEYPGEGTYLLKFDNSYSLWRNKTLYYRVYYSD
ncbi:protein TMED8 [Erpetoichthys calabaricus]|uniref:Transmembrane p24 trafficking protein 8 n=1 Tax=Erpetoichthys calabaricus TaxID=27687 RepID=A0A8C4SV89_ERPCA|nr:protein TMED8 [Erpetoichthys calabaricus]